ncbi:MAG TPA: hypothetical protein VFJ85_05830 [Acidimicrobiales bacterium]|nr:hypothetical protein [Acidimicrobiales bacterium]
MDDGYLQAELLLAVGRAGREEPRRAGFWHAMAGLLAAEQQRRRQGAELTGPEESVLSDDVAAALEYVQEQLRLDSETLTAQYQDAIGGFPAPAGQAPLVGSTEAAEASPAAGEPAESTA